MRLTIVNQFYPPDLAPTAHLAASLARHRASLGDEVTVITGRSGYVATATDERRAADATDPDHQVRVVRVTTPGNGKSSVVNRLVGYLGFHVGALVRLLGLRRQDVIITMTTPPYVVTGAMAVSLLSRRTRVVLWSMDVYPDMAEQFDQVDPDGTTARALRAINRWVYPRLDHLVTLDAAMADHLRTSYGRDDAPPMTVIPNWEPADLFADRSETAPWSGYDEAPLAGRSVIAYTGNTGTGHRFDTVVAAAGRLDPERDAFVFVGGGVRWSELDAASVALADGRGAPIVLHGYVDKAEIPGVLAGATASLITLDDRALGLMSPSKLHSNLAMGLPIVYVGPAGSNVDAAIERFGCGFSLRHGDVDGLAEAITSLREDPDLRSRMAADARRAFDAAYSDSVTLPAFDAVIDEL
ncbi:MAG: glycosyltransferase family 4 protein [Acidimicrobiales bacterium]